MFVLLIIFAHKIFKLKNTLLILCKIKYIVLVNNIETSKSSKIITSYAEKSEWTVTCIFLLYGCIWLVLYGFIWSLYGCT